MFREFDPFFCGLETHPASLSCISVLKYDLLIDDPVLDPQSPFHFLPSLRRTKHGGYNITFLSLSSCTTRLLSGKHCLHMVLAHTTTCFVPRSTGRRSRTQKSILPSCTSCIIHEAINILSRGSAAPNTQKIYTSLKPPRFPATSTLQHPRGYVINSRCRSYRQENCLRLCAWIHLSSLNNFCLQRPNSALVHSEAQNTPQFLEGCC